MSVAGLGVAAAGWRICAQVVGEGVWVARMVQT